MKISTLSSRARRARILPLLAVALLAGAGEAAAISRYNSNGLTCEAARETVRAEGRGDLPPPLQARAGHDAL